MPPGRLNKNNQTRVAPALLPVRDSFRKTLSHWQDSLYHTMVHCFAPDSGRSQQMYNASDSAIDLSYEWEEAYASGKACDCNCGFGNVDVVPRRHGSKRSQDRRDHVIDRQPGGFWRSS